MKWFKHDANAIHDARIEKLILKHGIEGYGLYFACIELIAGSLTPEKPTFELEHDAELLAHKFNCDTLKVANIVKYCVELELFEINQSNNRISCLKLAKRLDDATSRNPEIKRILNNFDKVGETSTKSEQTRLDEIREDKTREDKIYRRIKHLAISDNDVSKLQDTYTIRQIDSILDDIENYKKNTKYTSLYLTAKKWLEKDKPTKSGSSIKPIKE